MDVVEDCLTKIIKSDNFPAKLWRLVNNPVNEAIFWDKDGLVVVIDQILFEQQVLSPRNSSSASNNADTFQTGNFSSFLRNLNLYGFKKSDTYDDVKYRYYHHPNFKREYPELVASLVRLTVVNKAKLEAGLKVKPWTPRRYTRGCGGGDQDGQIGNHSLPSTPHRKSAHPYCPNKAPAVTAHNGTPVPPWFLTWGRSTALSPAAFATDKGIPMTLSQHYAGAASSSNAMPIQQSLLPRSNHGNPNLTNQPGYYMPFYQCYYPNLVASQMAGDGLQKGSYPTDSHYQASCPVNVLSHVDRNQD
ncbi:hypothetical protein VZT92_005979 [Zoarces viviparus]|uniref:HSF-type DNA-binding domain-containing protein n=1 Tax=Zoarces viviparus TaxID=48416 RepID=A0AAW1FPV5_ZOAVI